MKLVHTGNTVFCKKCTCFVEEYKRVYKNAQMRPVSMVFMCIDLKIFGALCLALDCIPEEK